MNCACDILKIKIQKEGLGGGGGGWGGEVTAPPLCDLTQMTLMQVLHTGSYLHRWEPLRKTLYTESRHLVYCVPGYIWGNLEFSEEGGWGTLGIWGELRGEGGGS